MKKIDPTSLPLVENSDGYAPCVCKESIGKFICIGLNYSDHAEETGQKVPPEPIIFAKATSAVIGPNDNVEIPKKSVKSDWEVELGVIIGKEAKQLILQLEKRLPNYLVACIGGGSNALGLFYPFLNDDVEIIGVEAGGKGVTSGKHAASISKGKPGFLHG